MLDFQRSSRRPNDLPRRQRGRLAMLVLGLGLVLILAREARNPAHYRWLLPEKRSGTDPAAPPPRGSHATETGRPGSALSEGAISPEGRESMPLQTPLAPGPASQASPRRFPGVDPRKLEQVRDNKPVGPSEWGAWLHLFSVLEQNEQWALERASIGGVTRLQLSEQPQEYRGELVTTGGVVRRAHPAKTPENQYGLSDYYQLWLWPGDDPNNPIAVWCLHLPEGFPLGMEIAERAEVTGFSFKVYSYQAGDRSMRRAPLLLARSVRWRQRERPAASPPPEGPLAMGLMIGSAALLALAATGYVYYRTRRPGRPRPPLLEVELPSPLSDLASDHEGSR